MPTLNELVFGFLKKNIKIELTKNVVGKTKS